MNDRPDLSVPEAAAAIAAIAPPALPVETLALAQAPGRVLAHDLVSPLDVPGHDNAAMDGFAFDGAALQSGVPLTLRCVATALAGRPLAQALAPGECVRIMTGAAMPPGLDTVVPFEACSAADGVVRLAADRVRRGDHRRCRGEDLARGQTALHAGRVLRPADLGLIASLGLAAVDVRRRLRVAVFSTGDEVVPPGRPLPLGSIYDSNRSSLAAAVARLGLEVHDFGAVRDDPQALAATLRTAAECCDAVITSGGVSAGDADHTRDVMATLGDVTFWKIAMRPGRPFAFGRLHGGALLYALPGNPVAALVAFYVLVRDALLRQAGALPRPLPQVRMRCATALHKRVGRSEFQRAAIRTGADGLAEAHALPQQGSGVLRGMSEADALIVLDEAQGPVAAGDTVNLWLFDGLV